MSFSSFPARLQHIHRLGLWHRVAWYCCFVEDLLPQYSAAFCKALQCRDLCLTPTFRIASLIFGVGGNVNLRKRCLHKMLSKFRTSSYFEVKIQCVLCPNIVGGRIEPVVTENLRNYSRTFILPLK
jgi:hypothetical protein